MQPRTSHSSVQMTYWRQAGQMLYPSCVYKLQEEKTIYLGRIHKGLLRIIQWMIKSDTDDVKLMKKIMMLAQRDGPNVETIPLMTIPNQIILKSYPCAMHFLEDNFYSPVFRKSTGLLHVTWMSIIRYWNYSCGTLILDRYQNKDNCCFSLGTWNWVLYPHTVVYVQQKLLPCMWKVRQHFVKGPFWMRVTLWSILMLW